MAQAGTGAEALKTQMKEVQVFLLERRRHGAPESSSPSRAPPTAPIPDSLWSKPPAACPSDPQLHTGLDNSDQQPVMRSDV